MISTARGCKFSRQLSICVRDTLAETQKIYQEFVLRQEILKDLSEIKKKKKRLLAFSPFLWKIADCFGLKQKWHHYHYYHYSVIILPIIIKDFTTWLLWSVVRSLCLSLLFLFCFFPLFFPLHSLFLEHVMPFPAALFASLNNFPGFSHFQGALVLPERVSNLTHW